MKKLLFIAFSLFAFNTYAQMDTTVSGNLIIIQDTGVTKLMDVRPLKPKTQKGYRVQIASSGSRSEIINIKSVFMQAHPGVRTYMTYQQPYFKLRVGDFEERTDANRFMEEIYNEYPGFIVEDVINTGEGETDKK